MKLNLLDLVIMGLLTFGIWRGYVSGFIKEMSQIVGLFAAFAVALHTMKPAGVFFVSIINVVDVPAEAAALVAFITIFLVVYIVVFLLSKLLERVADGAKLGPVNKVFGGVFGAVKTAALVSILFVFLGQIGIPKKETASRSYLHAPIERIAPEAWKVFTRSVPTAMPLTESVGERFWKKKSGEPAQTPASEE